MCGESLRQELKTYEREKPRLLGEGEGKFALIKGDIVAGVWDTYEDAIQAGYTQFKLEPFLVKKIEAMERLHFFTRDLVECC